MTKREAGRLGYLKVIAKMGRFDFHSAGGSETARKIDAWNCPCHGVGLAGYVNHGNKLKGKKYRY